MQKSRQSVTLLRCDGRTNQQTNIFYNNARIYNFSMINKKLNNFVRTCTRKEMAQYYQFWKVSTIYDTVAFLWLFKLCRFIIALRIL